MVEELFDYKEFSRLLISNLQFVIVIIKCVNLVISY